MVQRSPTNQYDAGNKLQTTADSSFGKDQSMRTTHAFQQVSQEHF